MQLHTYERQHAVELHVTDHGNDFQEPFATHAIEPFTRDRRPSGPGSDLGLAMVAAIAHAHGGTAELRNLDGRTDALITLPQPEPSHDQRRSPNTVAFRST